MASCMGAWCKRSARLMSQPASRSNWAISRLLFRTASVTKSTKRTFTKHPVLHCLCHKINEKDIYWTFSSAPPLSQNQQKGHSPSIQFCIASVTKSTKRTFTEHSALHHLCHKINKKDIYRTSSSNWRICRHVGHSPSSNWLVSKKVVLYLHCLHMKLYNRSTQFRVLQKNWSKIHINVYINNISTWVVFLFFSFSFLLLSSSFFFLSFGYLSTTKDGYQQQRVFRLWIGD